MVQTINHCDSTTFSGTTEVGLQTKSGRIQLGTKNISGTLTSMTATGIVKSDTNIEATDSITCVNAIASTDGGNTINGVVEIVNSGGQNNEIRIGTASANESEIGIIEGMLPGEGYANANRAIVLDDNRNLNRNNANPGINNIDMTGTLTAQYIETQKLNNVDGTIETHGTGNITAYSVKPKNGLKVKAEILTQANADLITGVSAGTVVADKAIILDSNKDIDSTSATERINDLKMLSADNGTLTAQNIVISAGGKMETSGTGQIIAKNLKSKTGLNFNNVVLSKTELQPIALKNSNLTPGDIQPTSVVSVDANKRIGVNNTDKKPRNLTIDGTLTLSTGTVLGSGITVNGTVIGTGSGATIYTSVPNMLAGMGTTSTTIGTKAMVTDTTGNVTEWVKLGTIANPYYYITTTGITQPVQNITQFKYKLTNANNTSITTYDTTISNPGSSTNNIILTDANNKFIHYEITVTDELQPIITAPEGPTADTTNNTTTVYDANGNLNGVYTTDTATTPDTHTFRHYIEFKGTIPITTPFQYIIKSRDQGLNASPPITNVFKLITLSLRSTPPTLPISVITHSNMDSRLEPKVDGNGWRFSSISENGITTNNIEWHTFKEGKTYKLYGMNSMGWVGVEPSYKNGNQLLDHSNFNTDCWKAYWTAYGKDTYNISFRGYGGSFDINSIATEAVTFVALKESHPGVQNCNLYPMVDPNGAKDFSNVYLTKHNRANWWDDNAPRNTKYAGLISHDISWTAGKAVFVHKAPTNFSGTTPIYGNIERFNLFMNWPGQSLGTVFDWKTTESETNYSNNPKAIFNGSGMQDAPLSNQGLAHSSRLGYSDFYYNPTSGDIGHKWSTAQFCIVALD